MDGALAPCMDAVMFHLKGAHLAAQRVGRRLLRGFAMTPARFDLMNALGPNGMKQSDLWRRLNVVRSVVCEMVRALGAIGWVKRVRAADGRTWLVQRTRRGTRVFEGGFAERVESGDATVHLDFAVTHGYVENDAMRIRNDLVWVCDGMMCTLRMGPPFRGPDLYDWRPEDYAFWLVEKDDFATEVPFVS